MVVTIIKFFKITFFLFFLNNCSNFKPLYKNDLSSLHKLQEFSIVTDQKEISKKIQKNLIELFPINRKTKHLSETIEVEIHQNKKLVSSGSVKNMFKKPIDVIHDFINKARENNFTITPGQWVASGGLTSCKPISTDEGVNVDFINLDCMNFKIRKNQNDL